MLENEIDDEEKTSAIHLINHIKAAGPHQINRLFYKTDKHDIINYLKDIYNSRIKNKCIKGEKESLYTILLKNSENKKKYLTTIQLH